MNNNNPADNESFGAGPLNVASGTAARVYKDKHCFLWSRVHLSHDSIVPPPRSGAASVVVQGKLYMFGGYGGGTGRLDDFYSFDFSTSTWEEVKIVGDQKPGCRENNGVVISGSSQSIYLFGGYNGSSWLNDLWKFDIVSKQWTCIQESSDPRSAADETNMAIGDFDNNNNNNIHNNNENGEDDNGQGTTVRGKVPTRRFGYVSVVHDNKLVLFGGFDGSRWLNDMYVFDFETKSWSEIHAQGMLPSVRSCPAWAKDDTHVYIQGGYDGVERKDDFFACDLSTYTWTQMPSLGATPSPRYFHSCCLYGNKMFLYGGYSGNQRLADMYAYDFETNHWSVVDCTNGEVPSGRSSLVAQVYENCLYIFGGYNGSTVLNDFYKFRLRPIGVPPPALVNDLRKLVNDPDMSDVCFLVEGKEVYAHRAILAIRSEFFRVLLFNGRMRESVLVTGAPVDGCDGASNNAPIELRDVSHTVFVKVLEYLYTDNVRDVTLELGILLLIASEQFMLDRLKALCEDIIRRDINLDNVINILVTSQQHNALGLKEIALEYIMRNLSQKSIQQGLSALKAEPDLLVEIIKLSSSQPAVVVPNSQPAPPQEVVEQPILQQQPQQVMQQMQHDPLGNVSMNGPFGARADWTARR